MNARVKVAVLFALLVLGGFGASGQQPQTPPVQGPTFRTAVEYVEVDAVVTDQQGNFVKNLTKDDFQVFEDGKPQSISTFSVVDIPIERFDRPLYTEKPIEPDVFSN
jgi:hypothetical protein